MFANGSVVGMAALGPDIVTLDAVMDNRASSNTSDITASYAVVGHSLVIVSWYFTGIGLHPRCCDCCRSNSFVIAKLYNVTQKLLSSLHNSDL